MKHAYLIIAHSNWQQLQKLVALLDDERNDIYIHIDKKADRTQLSLKTQYSPIYFVDRIDIRWGYVSLVEAEIKLFKEASKRKYEYYHLLSGSDMPLHNQNYIHTFCEQHKGMEFIGFGPKEWNVKRVYCRNFFIRYERSKWKLVKKIFQILRAVMNRIQIYTGMNVQKNTKLQFRYGSEWVSVTHDFVVELLKKEDEILAMYKYSYCPDEIYKQTFAFNSSFRERVFDLNDEFHGCMREIDWDRGGPYTWHTEDDYKYLSNSTRLFARKFDYGRYPQIIDKLVEKIKNEKY